MNTLNPAYVAARRGRQPIPSRVQNTIPRVNTQDARLSTEQKQKEILAHARHIQKARPRHFFGVTLTPVGLAASVCLSHKKPIAIKTGNIAR